MVWRSMKEAKAFEALENSVFSKCLCPLPGFIFPRVTDVLDRNRSVRCLWRRILIRGGDSWLWHASL